MKRYLLLFTILITGAILTQGFQCSSPEFTTAKVKNQNKEYDEAERLFKKEIAQNPRNEEAYLYLAEMYLGPKKDALKAWNVIQSGKKMIKKPENVAMVTKYEYNIWVTSRADGLKIYNEYYKTKDDSNLDNALENLKLALKIRPAKPYLYGVVANIYEFKKDTNTAIEYYTKIDEITAKANDFALGKGLYIGMPIKDAEYKLGKSEKTIKPDTEVPGEDYRVTDNYTFDGKKFILFTSRKAEEENILVRGWRYDPPEIWIEEEVNRWEPLDLYPYLVLTQLHFDRKNYDAALRYIKKVISLDPNNVEANRFLVTIYTVQDKMDDAIKYMADLIKKQPDNKYYLNQYAQINLEQGNYDEAIKYYEKAVEADPNYCDPLRNLGSCYKNKAVTIQAAEVKKNRENNSYEIDEKKYFPLLEKSAEAFNNARKCKTYEKDIDVLGELANIYLVLDKQDKLKAILNELLPMENDLTVDQKAKLYSTLIPVYIADKKIDKLNELDSKIEAIEGLLSINAKIALYNTIVMYFGQAPELEELMNKYAQKFEALN